MLTMTSLAAQNQFGALIDASLRQPVAVTRRGRPVSVVVSYEDYQASMQLISESYPLRGNVVGDAMREHLSKMSHQAAMDGLTEGDVMQMLRDE